MRTKRLSAQRGAVAVEVAMLAPWFFLFLFMGIELARFVFVSHVVHQATRRAARMAAVTDYTDLGAIAALKDIAMLNVNGKLLLAPDPSLLRIDYLRQDSSGALSVLSTLPACPAQNKVACASDPFGASCIRYVRVSLCEAGGSGSCSPLPYTTLISDVAVKLGGTLHLPTASTTVPVQSLGNLPGANACP